MSRKPVALTNWKMEMTITESLAFLQRFQAQAGDLLSQVQVILCPPYTALYAMAQALTWGPIELGAQTVSTAAGGAHTGEISARLVADAGGRWAQLGHWELRRNLSETDEVVSRKVHRALEAGLRLILLVGEGQEEGADHVAPALERQLGRVLAGCSAEPISRSILVYEPEWTIGVTEPAPPQHVAAGCRIIRGWLAERYGQDTAQAVRLVYGGSVAPAYARELLTLADLDGLGAGRKGRDPDAFAEIVRLIALARAQRTDVR
jgi:triosephosphate isomerase